MKKATIFTLDEFDELIKKEYNKTYYSFQQQDGCKDRGIEFFTVPINDPDDLDYLSMIEADAKNNKLSEHCGVKFEEWLSRDKDFKWFTDENEQYRNELLWERNFYPHPEIIFNDLYKRNIIEAGTYGVYINW